MVYALKSIPETGTLRETFLFNQLINANLPVTLPKAGDFYTQHTNIEVGGKGKTIKQVKNENDFLIAADDIEIGYGNRIPLWLFGFLY